MADIYYSTLYRIDMRLIVNDVEILPISSGDIVSFSMIHQFDTKTYPMIRLRIYSDLSLLQYLTDNPDKIELRMSMDGGIYKMETDKTPVLVKPTSGLSFALKVYIEFKNTPTSVMDQYQNGLPGTTDGELNVNNKVPIELYCYNDKLIHRMKNQPPQIYKNLSIQTTIESMLQHCKIKEYYIDSIVNQSKFDQILFPNLSMIDSLSFLDKVYGLYPKGGMLYGEYDKLKLLNLAVDNGTTPIPIYVNSYQNNSDMTGVRKTDQGYFMETGFSNVSILSESDIEYVLNSERFKSINLKTLDIDGGISSAVLDKINQYVIGEITETRSITESISPTFMLHKSPNPYIIKTFLARLDEKITKIDISGAGFDITKLTAESRFNLIFDSPIRGMNVADIYRPTYICNILNGIGSDLFSATTTMSICKN